MGIPESTKSQRPTQMSYRSEIQQKAQNVTGKNIGKITEENGFIPNIYGLRLMQEMQLTPDVALSAKNYGAYEVLQKMIPDLSDSEEDKQILGTLGVELLRKIDVSVTTDISIEY